MNLYVFIIQFQQVSSNYYSSFYIFLFLFLYPFWPCCVACGPLVPQPGIEPRPPALGVWSLNPWTTREIPSFYCSINIANQCPPLALLLLLLYRFGGGKFDTLKCTNLSCKNVKNGYSCVSHMPMMYVPKFLYPSPVHLLDLHITFLKDFTVDYFYSRASYKWNHMVFLFCVWLLLPGTMSEIHSSCCVYW